GVVGVGARAAAHRTCPGCCTFCALIDSLRSSSLCPMPNNDGSMLTLKSSKPWKSPKCKSHGSRMGAGGAGGAGVTVADGACAGGVGSGNGPGIGRAGNGAGDGTACGA